MESLLTFGRQHFSVSPLDFGAVPGLAGIVKANPQLQDRDNAYAESFFRAIGISRVESMDVSAYESCSLVHDLNNPIPTEWHSRYDVVFDGGTLEHVFHFPNAIANAMNLVKVGGVFVTATPSNNYNGHGFYQFSPELFFRLFNEASGFEVLMMAFSESFGRRRIFKVEDPAELGKRITFPGDGPLILMMVARRTRLIPAPSGVPYQSDYFTTWNKNGTAPGTPPAPRKPGTLKRALRRTLPERWMLRYDTYRWEQHQKKKMLEGITLVPSVDECFLPSKQDATSLPLSTQH
ncbi:MAG: hypothetical protein EOP87_07330 [Verrucomicrobiaceae bacterium]|nr:MAG: hypothetical protein EOP87_07330 [Verrucomicrobiaceae bacterium]